MLLIIILNFETLPVDYPWLTLTKTPNPCQGLGFFEGQKILTSTPTLLTLTLVPLRVCKPLHITTLYWLIQSVILVIKLKSYRWKWLNILSDCHCIQQSDLWMSHTLHLCNESPSRSSRIFDLHLLHWYNCLGIFVDWPSSCMTLNTNLCQAFVWMCWKESLSRFLDIMFCSITLKYSATLSRYPLNRNLSCTCTEQWGIGRVLVFVAAIT